ncbi:hypothetical protein DPMN_028801 [Dreissena polymorpha]|uniref:Uncharacterized protein n=1 Tax=Dreissena polymorpha TaxID=45954 RepID=A0A9D4LXX4_DREPO|nr:hypothetical protein DPMN_028801 [Dreissena polymorpha]
MKPFYDLTIKDVFGRSVPSYVPFGINHHEHMCLCVYFEPKEVILRMRLQFPHMRLQYVRTRGWIFLGTSDLSGIATGYTTHMLSGTGIEPASPK